MAISVFHLAFPVLDIKKTRNFYVNVLGCTVGREDKNWIDFNAGKLLTGTSMEDLLEEFVDSIVAVANGELTCNEKNNMREIAIFKSGVTL